MKSKSLLIFALSVIIIFAGVFVADQLGYWSTTSSGDLMGGDKESEIIADPELLRGSTTFEEIELSFDISSKRLAQAYNFDTLEPSLLKVMYVSDAFAYLGEDVEMGTGSVKLFIYLYNGLDFSGLEEIENIPSTAVEVLKADGKWTDDIENVMLEYIVDIDRGPIIDAELSALMEDENNEETAEASSSEEGAEAEETTVSVLEINGKTIIQDIIDAGLSQDKIEESMGVEIGNVNLGFRDICDSNELDFSAQKTKILELIEAQN